MAKIKPIALEPTMGVSSDTYRMLCNVVSRRGVLERRPRIVATSMGYSTSFAPSELATQVGTNNFAFAPQWRVHSKTSNDIVVIDPPGGLTASARYITTDYELQKVGTSDNPKNISSISFGSGMATVTATGHGLVEGDKVYVYQADTGAAGPGVGEHVHSRTLYSVNTCLEGIDCEVIQGKIVATYIGKTIQTTTVTLYAQDVDTFFYHSYHHPGDPRMGKVRSASIFGSTKDDYPRNWYQQAAYWKRRIVPSFTDYMITGHNVGPKVVGNTTNASINEADSVSLFTGFPLKMLGDNQARTTIPRLDPYSSFYSLYSPKNAFAHVDRHSGQTIWYGFLDGENFTLNGTLPADDVLLMEAEGDINDARDTLITRPYHIWYSEPGSPLSLSVVGWVPLTIGSHDKNIVGMADYRNGTAIFSHDTIHFMRGIGADTGSNAVSRVIIGDGIGADSPWSIKSVGDGVVFANTEGLHYLDQSGGVREITGFSELFSETGVDCARGPYHQYFSNIGNTPDVTASDDSGSVANSAYGLTDSHPWRTFKIDKSRLDRAVAGVWGDLYLLFVSLDGDPYGEDNRLCLCWNWKESGSSPRQGWKAGPTSVWLMPKNMGVRGWAYDGSLATPYVMTRYGLARFENSPGDDIPWKNTGPTEANGSSLRDPPRHPLQTTESNSGYGYINSVLSAGSCRPFIMGQSHWMGETGDSFVTTNVIVQHETKADTYRGTGESWTDALSASHVYNGGSSTTGCAGGDTDGKMRIRLWAMQGEMMQSSGNMSSYPFAKMRFTKADIDPLENLVSREDFKVWRGRHSRHSAITWGPLDTEGTIRLPGGIRRASSARSGFSASRCAFQFSTSNPDKIVSVQVLLDSVAPRGEGA